MSQPNRPKADPNDMTLIGHLAELRSRLIKSLLALVAGCAATWNFAEEIVGFILRPVIDILPPGQTLIYTGLQDAFIITFKTGLWAGLFLTTPFWMYQIWAFVAPALKPREKQRAPLLAGLATILMLAGAAFAYFLAFPLAFKFFLTFSTELMHPLLAVDRYLSLAMGLILAFALAFQLPLALMFLGHLGLVEAPFLRRHRRYAVLIAFILGALLTPPDVVSQCLLAVSLLLLYELSIILMPKPADK